MNSKLEAVLLDVHNALLYSKLPVRDVYIYELVQLALNGEDVESALRRLDSADVLRRYQEMASNMASTGDVLFAINARRVYLKAYVELVSLRRAAGTARVAVLHAGNPFVEDKRLLGNFRRSCVSPAIRRLLVEDMFFFTAVDRRFFAEMNTARNGRLVTA